MHLLTSLKDLQFSILVTTLALTVSALPVNSLELAQDTFDSSVSKGLWFIEHFSPWCGHCKAFKPTWDQLVIDAETEIPAVKLATIDCTTQGDLCDKNGVKGYPTMFMFDDGKIVGQYKGYRELDDLKSFIKRYLKDEKPASPPAAPAGPEAAPAPKQSPSKKVPAPILNPTGEVLEMTTDVFDATLAKGPTFVKFFAPWCGHCKKLAPIWKQLARHMQSKLTVAEVNCDDHGALCKAQGIQGYPTLVYYNDGAKSEYNGGRKLEQLKAFSEKASAAGVQPLDKPEDLEAHVAKEDVVYLLLHSSADTELLSFVREASASLLGTPTIYASSSPSLRTRFSVPVAAPWAIIGLKDHDTELPAAAFYGSPSITSSKLKSWLLAHRVPTVLELTQDSFQGVMNAPQAPLVVIAAADKDTKEKIQQRFRDVGKKWRVRTDGSGVVHGREVVFTWMDVDKWAEWMKSMYGITPAVDKEKVGGIENVKVVIADHSKLIYYDSDRSGNAIKFTSSASIFSAVDDAASGKTSFKHSENMVERIARYLSNKLKSIETYVVEKPMNAILFILIAVGLLFWGLHRLIGNDTSSEVDFRDYKGKNGRLD
ncbi:protein disulfide isomerase [Crassisporium funariophilum]|nr:protein disulfide isomerase [Crassisporium funariophilum]